MKGGEGKEWLVQPRQRLSPESFQRAICKKKNQTCSSLKAALLRHVTLLSPLILETRLLSHSLGHFSVPSSEFKDK